MAPSPGANSPRQRQAPGPPGKAGAELAQVFARFGARVTAAEALPRLLPAEEPDAAHLLAGVFTRDGITVRTGARAERAGCRDGQFTVDLAGGETLTARRLLVAAGRRAGLAAPGIAAAGLDETARAIPVDDRMRAADRVRAVGEDTGNGAFPTWPSTGQRPRPVTSSARTGHPRTTRRCPGSPSPAPRSARPG